MLGTERGKGEYSSFQLEDRRERRGRLVWG